MNRRILCIAAALCLSAIVAKAQPRPYLLTDINGIPFSQQLLKTDDPKGSPYLYDQWSTGEVVLADGKKVDSLPLIFNLATNKLLFFYDNKSLQFETGVQEFRFTEKQTQAQHHFRGRFPAITGHDENSLYEVLAEGKRLQLLQYVEKVENERRSYDAPSSTEYELAKSYYLYDAVEKTLQKIKLKKATITEAFPALATNIETLCTQQNWTLKTVEELKLLVEQLN